MAKGVPKNSVSPYAPMTSTLKSNMARPSAMLTRTATIAARGPGGSRTLPSGARAPSSATAGFQEASGPDGAKESRAIAA